MDPVQRVETIVGLDSSPGVYIISFCRVAYILSRARDSKTRFVHWSVGRSVGRTVSRLVGWSHFTFFMILFLWPHSSCPCGLVTSNMAPAHPHATSVAVYPALFSLIPADMTSKNKRLQLVDKTW